MKNPFRSFLQSPFADPIGDLIRELQNEFRERAAQVLETTDKTALNTAEFAGKIKGLDDLMERINTLAQPDDDTA